MQKKPEFSPEQESCITTISGVFGGRHHIHNVKPWGLGVIVTVYGDLSTYDFNTLTCLVLAAHRDAVRITIESGSKGTFKITGFQRKGGKRGSLHMHEWHPGLNHLILSAEKDGDVDNLTFLKRVVRKLESKIPSNEKDAIRMLKDWIKEMEEAR